MKNIKASKKLQTRQRGYMETVRSRAARSLDSKGFRQPGSRKK